MLAETMHNMSTVVIFLLLLIQVVVNNGKNPFTPTTAIKCEQFLVLVLLYSSFLFFAECVVHLNKAIGSGNFYFVFIFTTIYPKNITINL